MREYVYPSCRCKRGLSLPRKKKNVCRRDVKEVGGGGERRREVFHVSTELIVLVESRMKVIRFIAIQRLSIFAAWFNGLTVLTVRAEGLTETPPSGCERLQQPSKNLSGWMSSGRFVSSAQIQREIVSTSAELSQNSFFFFFGLLFYLPVCCFVLSVSHCCIKLSSPDELILIWFDLTNSGADEDHRPQLNSIR